MANLKRRVLVSAGDSFDHWHRATCREFSLTEPRAYPGDKFCAQIAVREFGPLMINEIASESEDAGHVAIVRNPSHVRKDPRDYFLLWLAVGGVSEFCQGGNQVRLRPGDLVLHDQAQPCELMFENRSRSLTVSIPRPLLTSRIPDACSFTAKRISGRADIGKLLGETIKRLSVLDEAVLAHEVCLSRAALDILTTVIQVELSSVAAKGTERDRLAKAKRHIEGNLGDPDFNLTTIAASQEMSPRTLIRLFAMEGTTPMRWVWQRRLEHCYRALSEQRNLRITDAAFSFGFNDLSHFSRSFKARFGVSPQSLKAGRE